jgi:uncharacterized protein RhaS with RHS repeats
MTLAQAYKKQFGKVSYPFEIYDSNGNMTYHEDSKGNQSKTEYDSKGNETYYEDSAGHWSKREYDSNGNVTYYENSTGAWSKTEYDSNGNETHYEDSYGTIRGSKKCSCNGKVVEIDGKKYKLKEL